MHDLYETNTVKCKYLNIFLNVVSEYFSNNFSLTLNAEKYWIN